LDVSADAPYLDCAYKLQEYAGLPRRKRSEGQATWPGRKQVVRTYDQGLMAGDVVTLEDDPRVGEPLLRLVMQHGCPLESPSLTETRARAAANLAQLPQRLRTLEDSTPYPVEISSSLRNLAQSLDAARKRTSAKSGCS
jgi:nicotinate phosphoribosyltransferase